MEAGQLAMAADVGKSGDGSSSMRYALAFAVSFVLISCSESEEAAPAACFVSEQGKEKFLGSPFCLSTLPDDEFVGYWRIGFETSLFFEKLDEAVEGDGSEALWLDDEVSGIPVITDPVRSEIYFVSFSGHSSTMEGYYGGDGLGVKGGVLMEEVHKIEKLATDTSS